ncbi:MAG: hypothetical protein AAFY57_11710 [Cyanobacteria bacterium J06642_2]
MLAIQFLCTEIRNSIRHDQTVTSVSWIPNGGYVASGSVASGSDDRTVTLWVVKAGQCVQLECR